MEKAPLLKEGAQKVAPWLYGECACGTTIAGAMWIMNVVCCVFHLGLAVTSLMMGCSYPTDAPSCGSPTLTVYGNKLTWQGGTDPLVPEYEQLAEGYNLTWMTTWFFLLSALAHGVNKPLFFVIRLVAFPITYLSYSRERAALPSELMLAHAPLRVHALLSLAHFSLYGLMLKWGWGLLLSSGSSS